MSDETDIAVIGLAGRFPGAADVTEFWQNLRAGRESVTRLDSAHLRAHGVPDEISYAADYVPAAAMIDGYADFDAGFFGYSGQEAALLDPQQRMFLELCWTAFEDAGYRPTGYAGLVGVYAAANMSTYLVNNVLGGHGMAPGAETLEHVLANDKDYLASRVAYQLGLTGPTMSVQTACSSSLVAVHLAAQALLSEECDLALAGGVALRFPHEVGYQYQAGLIFSADGHCRPFDAAASGTVAGNGAGVVVLKRLADALADGDHVEAVLKGSAMNNDGAARIGYTAPSAEGQAEVISAALAVAGVDPASIGAIEAHGTGTALGDPIEFTALQRVFGPDDAAPPCRVGAVKGNLGHLDSAAGITSFIKAVLQLRHRELVPSINYDTPNPEIDFAAGRVVVNTELLPWQADGQPLRIGVSSFGMGGANAHAVLEQAPEPAAPAAHTPGQPQLLVLSGRGPGAVDAAAGRLADALDDGVSVVDTAATLQDGRSRFGHRRFAVAATADAAAAALRSREPALTGGGVALSTADEQPGVVWMFPGQGSQYPGMGRELYENVPVFRYTVDECATLFAGHLGTDLRTVLYPAGAPDHDALRQTALAQPALFTVEYALARTLASWGVTPAALLGHSVGELVAATVAGVFELADAATVIAARGRLMQEQPAGAMLSVAADAEQVRGLLGGDVALAADNAPGLCVVAGPAEAIAELAEKLSTEDIPSRALHTSHAFHSPMMRPVLEPFHAVLRGVRLGEPRVPVLSNRTGDWLTAEQATDPGYWAGQVLDPVRFRSNVERVRTPAVLVELGPGDTLGTFARQVVGADAAVTALLDGPVEPGPADLRALAGLGRIWVAGVEPDFAALRGGAGRRISLPGYAFQRTRYWVEPARVAAPGARPELQIGSGAEEMVDGLVVPPGLQPRPAVSAEYTAPATEIERALVQIWQRQLGVGPVGVHDAFLELGGHSLLATRVVRQVREEFEIDVPLRELLASPTVHGLAQVVGKEVPDTPLAAGPGGTAVSEVDSAGIPRAVPDPAGEHEPFPLSEIQQAQWIGRMGSFAGGDVPAYVYWEVDAPELDADRLQETFDVLLHRHAMLRAVIGTDGRQRVLPDTGPYRFEVLDLRDAQDAGDRLTALAEELSTQNRPTDAWPLFDIRLSRLGERHYRLHLGFDLLIADIGSIRVLLRDWRALYTGAARELPPLELSYRDYVLASTALRDTPVWERARDYWRHRVTELPPAPDLPLLVAPEQAPQSGFSAFNRIVPDAQWSAFTATATEHGLTASSVLLALYADIVGTWCRSGAFTLNVTVTNRLEVHEQVAELVGEFASFDLLPVDLRTRPSLAELATAIQAQSWEDLEHRYFNGVDVLRELTRHNGGTSGAAMPVVFTSTLVQQLERAGDDSMFGWLGEMVHESARTPQVWMDAGVLPAADGVQLSWHGVATLFPDGMLTAMFEQFHAGVLRLAGERDAWREPLRGTLPAEHATVIDAANDTAGVQPHDYLYGPLLRHAAETPDNLAVIGPDGSLTFGELYRHACALAHRLREHELRAGELVAVLVPKGCAQVLAALAVQLAGAAYLPIDPDLPAERIAHLIDRGEARVALLSEPDAAVAGQCAVLTVDLGAEPSDVDGPVQPPEPVHTPDDLAYVIFTSGSTGEPKGVMLSHAAALNTLVDINERLGVGPDDRVLGLSSLSFDLSVWDVFGVLGAGGAVVLPESGARRDPARWLELVREHGVTLWNSVPALAQMFVEHLATLPEPPDVPVRQVLMSGDWIPVELPERIHTLLPGARVLSLGGATEAAVWSIGYEIGEVDPDWDSVPYGRPLRNQTFHVLNDRMRPCPFWVTGELYIGGAGVAEGYWRDPERTAASFVTHPDTGERLYRTGDLGRWLPEGNIQFLGREDFQVKVGGFRIELGEIESALLRHDGVAAAVAGTTGDRHHRRLVGYLVPADPAALDDAGRERLIAGALGAAAEILPEYMVPHTVLVLDTLPLTGNGKVDRGALPVPGGPAAQPGAGPAGATAEVLRLAALIADALGVAEVDPGKNFFEVGGDSITGVQAVGRANAEGMAVSLQDLFAAPTIADLAGVLSAGGAGVGGDGVPLDVVPSIVDGASAVRLAVDTCVELDALRAAAAELAVRHPMLRARVSTSDNESRIVPADADAGHGYVAHVDLSMVDIGAAELDELTEEICAELDPAAGRVSAMTLFELADGQRALVWAVHELVADARSWEVLLGELFELARGNTPPAPGDPFVRWAAGREPAGTGRDAGSGDAGHGVAGVLDAELTTALFEEARAAYRLAPRDVLLAALGAALGGPQRVAVLTDGRLDAPELNLDRTVGQFAAVRRYALALPEDTAAALPAVKEQLRGGTAGAPPDGAPTVLLRDLGDFAAEFAGHPMARASAMPWPRWRNGAGAAGMPVLSTAVFGGRLHWEWQAADGAGLAALSERFAGALRDIAEHCSGTGEAAVSTTDFPLAGVDDDQLRSVLATLHEE